MKKPQPMLWIASGLVLGLVPLIVAAQKNEPPKEKAAQPAAMQPQKITGKTLLAASEMKWMPMPGLEGAEQVTLAGDPTKEAHRILYRWKPGIKVPQHTHTHGDRGMIVSGTLSLAIDGAAPKHLPPGSWFQLAGGTKHVTAVEGDVPCVFYLEREGPFDAHMVEAAPAKKD
jgi:anti-sigma factor ChrR (cupin superfamily)